MTRKSNHYLKRRGERWHYYRRVPKKYKAIDTRGTIRIALDTDCLTIAREKRNRLAAADEALWQSSLMSLNGQGDEICALKQRHKFAQNRALALGFSFKPIDQLIASDNLMEIIERVEAVAKADDKVTEAEVLLGTIRSPKTTLREALELYMKTLSIGEQRGKSPDQLRKWRLPRQRAIEHFIAVCGNLPMEEIERSHARRFYEWWGKHLLLPQGTRLLGRYDSNIDDGQSRALIVWNRIIRPDGSSLVIENLPGVDLSGQAGLRDKVDRHKGSLFKAAILSYVLSIAAELSTDEEDEFAEAIRSGGQDTINQAGQRVVNRALSRKPTLSVRPGWRLGVIVNRDLVLSPYNAINGGK